MFSLDQPKSDPNTTTTSTASSQSRPQLLARLVATDLDAPPKLTYSLHRQIRIRRQAPDLQQLELVNMFDVDAETGAVYLKQAAANKRPSAELSSGLYALIVELSDRQSDSSEDESVQKSRVYVFLALAGGTSTLTSEITRLREILNQTRLNDQAASSAAETDDDYYDEYSTDEVKSQDFRFERVLSQLKQVSKFNRFNML